MSDDSGASSDVGVPADVPASAPVGEVTTPESVQEIQDAPVAAEVPAAPPPPAASDPVPSPQTQTAPSIASRLGEALEALRFRKRTRLDKILALAVKKKSIKNDDVEKLLHVSDATAQRYLNELVIQGNLRRVGSPHQPTYEPL